MKDPDKDIHVTAQKLGIGRYARHVMLCAGPDCCTAEAGEAAWTALKDELKNRNLSLSMVPNACFRTKANCLRVCSYGPIAVVYPEGTWYQGLTADRVPQFVTEHLEKGRPVREWVFAENPLPKTD